VSDAKRYIVRTEPLPMAGRPTEEQARLALSRADAAQALVQHEAWAFVEERMRGDRIAGHAGASSGEGTLALRLSNLVSDVLDGQIDLAGQLCIQAPAAGEGLSGREWTEKTAEPAIATAAKVKDFAGQPAFQWLSQLLGAVSMASRYAIEHGTGADIDYHVAVQHRVVQFFDDLQRDVDLGVDARAWIDQKHKEIVEREEKKDA